MAAYDPEKAINTVEDALLDNVTGDNRFLKPKGALLKKAANRFRSKMRPTEQNDGLLNNS